MLARPLEKRTEVPGAVKAVSGGGTVRLVWENELGGLTFEVTRASERRFVKSAPSGSGLDLGAELVRLRWAVGFTAVPPRPRRRQGRERNLARHRTTDRRDSDQRAMESRP